ARAQRNLCFSRRSEPAAAIVRRARLQVKVLIMIFNTSGPCHPRMNHGEHVKRDECENVMPLTTHSSRARTPLAVRYFRILETPSRLGIPRKGGARRDV